jgi:hypothetical protein
VLWAVFEGECLKDLKFDRHISSSYKNGLFEGSLGVGYKPAANIGDAASREGPAPHEVKQDDKFAIVADAPGWRTLGKDDYTAYWKANFYLVARSKTDGMIRAEIWYDVVIDDIKEPGKVEYMRLDVTKKNPP